MPMGMIVILVVVTMLVGGAALLAVGVRGRRIDDHPVCRRCRFDLVGLYPGGVACPECGGTLVGEDAVRIGRRGTRRAIVGVGAALSILGASGAGLLVWARASSANWYAYLPASMLAWEIQRSGDGTRASLEVTARLKVNALSGGDAAVIAEALLHRQADRGASWDSVYGDLIELLRAQGLFDEERWERSLLGSARFEVETRPIVRVGGPTILHGEIIHDRLGTRGPGHHGRYRVRLVSAMIDGRSLTPHEPDWWMACTSFIQSMSSQSFMTRLAPPNLVGPATIRTIWAVALLGPDEAPDEIYGTVPGTAGGAPERQATFAATQRETFIQRETIVQFVEAAEPLVQLVEDDAMTQWLLDSARVTRCEVQFMGHQEGIAISVMIPRPPLDLAAELRVRPAGGGRGEEVAVMRITASAASQSGAFAWHSIVALPAGSPLAGADLVDIVIRGSAEAAEETAAMVRVWGGEMLKKNVPVLPLAAPVRP